MSAEYSPFARPKFTAEDFARKESEYAPFDNTPIRPAEARSFVAGSTETFAASESLRNEEAPLTDRVDDDASAFAAPPVYAAAGKKSSGRAIHPVALVAVPAVALLAGVAFFAMQPRDTGVAELTPGSTATEAPAVATPAAPQIAAPTPAPAAMAPEPAAAAPQVSARVETPARVARARPAPTQARSADALAADASATLPAAPIPYSATAQTPGAAPAPIVVPSVTAAPEASITPVTPAPEPATPETAAPEAAEVPVP